MSALVKSEAFLQIDQDLLCEILKRDELRIREIEIWNAALRWADEQCRQKGIECSAENRSDPRHGTFLCKTNKYASVAQWSDAHGLGFRIVTAHRAILSSASDVFEAMFRYDEGQIEVTDIEIEAFKAMLTFIYSKHFNGLDANNLLEVLKAADKYNITGLVKECANFPIEKLPNVFVAFEQALLLNMEDKFSTENIGKILRDELRSSEIELWNAALRWSDEQCRQKGIECSAENRVPTDVLTIEEEISIYQHYSHQNLCDVPGLFPSKFPTQQRYKTIEMEIEKVSEFALEAVGSYRFSNAVEIGGFSWKILAEIRSKDESNEKWLGFFLYNDGSKKENLSCKSSPTFRIVSQKNGTEDLIGKFKEHIFKDLNLNCFGFPNSISFAELLDPSKGFYNKDEDKVKLAIDVFVDEPKTEQFISDPNKSNGTISMEIEKLSEFAREIYKSERKSETVVWKLEPQMFGNTSNCL
ncbi:hypothetical protein niasHS_004474 [Heterodera schachtii]|uniref:BTB/POZ domain-containing protein n=1 Tax=Heterodera schachtii TaxID=97005 RepID=A0ABD2JJG2_HETSC